jgi:hypothetical protein
MIHHKKNLYYLRPYLLIKNYCIHSSSQPITQLNPPHKLLIYALSFFSHFIKPYGRKIKADASHLYGEEQNARPTGGILSSGILYQ